MHKLSLALIGAAAVAFAGGARAADLPVKAAAAEQQPVSGYAGLYAGGTWTSYWVDSVQYHDTAGVFGGEGRLNRWFSRGTALQVDIEGEIAGSVVQWGESRGYGIIGAHLASRDPKSHAIGLFGGGLYTNNLDHHGNMSYAFGGVEAQAYWNQFTLYGQLGLIGRASGIADDQLKNGWFIRGEARYFATPNDKFSVEGGYIRGPGETGSGETKAANWGATYEHRFGNPLSLFISYQGFWFDDSPVCRAGVATENMVLAGFKLYLNEGTLAYNDRNGATWNMPKLRSLSWGDVANETHCAPPSDVRLKRDIVLLERLENGFGLYRYRYLWSDQVYVGVMAREVAAIMPDAVAQGADGYLRVDYSRLGMRLLTWNEWVWSKAPKLVLN
jgi:hypothetical protein